MLGCDVQEVLRAQTPDRLRPQKVTGTFTQKPVLAMITRSSSSPVTCSTHHRQPGIFTSLSICLGTTWAACEWRHCEAVAGRMLGHESERKGRNGAWHW
ncbi:unnamed protein product [Symbiodinium sp. CCMP2456]|nr:unnamed protein product [Symbiodinium sp. CCMP2456]